MEKRTAPEKIKDEKLMKQKKILVKKAAPEEMSNEKKTLLKNLLRTFQETLDLEIPGISVQGDLLERTIENVASAVSAQEQATTVEEITSMLRSELSKKTKFGREVHQKVEGVYERIFKTAVATAREIDGIPLLIADLDKEFAHILQLAQFELLPGDWIKQKLDEWKARERALMLLSEKLWDNLEKEIGEEKIDVLKNSLAATGLRELCDVIKEKSGSLNESIASGSVKSEVKDMWGELASERLRDVFLSKLDAADSMVGEGEIVKLQRKISNIQSAYKALSADDRSAGKKEYDARLKPLSLELKRLNAKTTELGKLFNMMESSFKSMVLDALTLCVGEEKAKQLLEDVLTEMSIREAQYFVGGEETRNNATIYRAARSMLEKIDRKKLHGTPLYFNKWGGIRKTGEQFVNSQLEKGNK